MRHTLAALLATLVLSSAAAAQDMFWSTVTPSIAGTDVLGITLREQMQRQKEGARPGAAARGTTTPELAALRYTPSRTRRAANLASFVQKTRAVDRSGAQDLERLFASGDVIEKLDEVMRPIGLRVDNVADAYAIWWIAAWNATQGQNPTPSRAQAQAVRDQVARALASTPAMRTASDAAKQEFAEAMLIQMIFADVAVEQNRDNPARLRALSSAVSRGARGMGLDLARMRLTESGFVPVP